MKSETDSILGSVGSKNDLTIQVSDAFSPLQVVQQLKSGSARPHPAWSDLRTDHTALLFGDFRALQWPACERRRCAVSGHRHVGVDFALPTFHLGFTAEPQITEPAIRGNCEREVGFRGSVGTNLPFGKNALGWHRPRKPTLGLDAACATRQHREARTSPAYLPHYPKPPTTPLYQTTTQTRTSHHSSDSWPTR